MKDVEYLYNKYDETRNELYIKCFYSMAITKIETKIKELIAKLDEEISKENFNIIAQFLISNKYYKERCVLNLKSSIISDLKLEDNSKILIAEKKLNILILLENPTTKKEDIEEIMNINRFESANDIFGYPSAQKIIQNPNGINKLYQVLTGKELFEKEKILHETDISFSFEFVTMTENTIIDMVASFNQIYNHRQNSVHNDLSKNIDFDKLSQHYLHIKMILVDLDEQLVEYLKYQPETNFIN